MEDLPSPAPRVGRPPASRLGKSERKQQLLEHAKRLFLDLGYHHTTTEKIAHAAGVTEPVLYRHFQCKKALFLEVLHEIRRATVQRWQEAARCFQDPAEMLHAIVDSYLGSTRSHAVEFRIMHRTLLETDDAEIADCLRSFYLDSETLLASVIRAGQASGQFRADLDPRVGAWEFIRSGLGYTLTLPLNVPLYQEEDYLRQAVRCIMSCLLTTSEVAEAR